MSEWLWIAGLFVYLLVGGFLLLQLNFRNPGLAPELDFLVVFQLLGWPLVLIVWAVLRGPESPVTPDQKPPDSARKLPPAGKAIGDLCPNGTVEVAGRQYQAIAEGRSVRCGEAVEIVGRVGRTLRVRAGTLGPQ